MEQLITAGGTAGLIGYLLFTVYQFASGKWRPGADLDAAHARTEAAITAGNLASAAAAKALEENAAWRAMVRQLLLAQGVRPPDDMT